MTMTPKPTIGRIVWYRSRTGKYTVPAIISATTETLYRPNVEAGFIDDLGENQVHLTVFTPGQPGRRPGAVDFVDGSDKPIAPNIGGLYQEWSVDFWESPGDFWPDEDQPAGTWTWPRRS
jgi:hypothetical protein